MIQLADILLKGILKAPEGSSKNKSDEFLDGNEEGKTYMRDMTKPVGDACCDDGMLKDVDEMQWPDLLTKLEAPQTGFAEPYPDYEPGFPDSDEFDQRSSTPLEFPESEDEITIPQKCTKVSMRVDVLFWSNVYSLSA